MADNMKVTCTVTFKWQTEDASKEGTIVEIAKNHESAILGSLNYLGWTQRKDITVETDYIGLDRDDF